MDQKQKKKDIYYLLAFLCYYAIYFKKTSNITLEYILILSLFTLSIIFYRKARSIGSDINSIKPKGSFGKIIINISIIMGVIFAVLYIIISYKTIEII
jgi:hypothetical protein